MQLIVLSSMSKYFSNNDIIIPHRHGFRRGSSTLTQLITVLDDWFSSLDRRTRTNVLLLDFAKAFDSVPHQGLLHKLHYYCIRNKTPEWIKSFLLGRSQRIHVNGAKSDWVDVTSGVPQGTVLGPFLFVTYLNGIACNQNSKIKLFTDDAVMYRDILSSQDEVILDKCNVVSITRSKSEPTFRCKMFLRKKKKTSPDVSKCNHSCTLPYLSIFKTRPSQLHLHLHQRETTVYMTP